MTFLHTGDPEPRPGVDVLVIVGRLGTEKRYLARFQHGWRWVDSKTELDRGDQTPLTWKFAAAVDARGPHQLRTLTDAERIDWLTS